LVEAQLHDHPGPGAPSGDQMRHLYAMTFVRFFNGVVDSEQKGLYAQSTANISIRLGMPNWFVDLRHSATHEELPPLFQLRKGCLKALEWLRTDYWQCQMPRSISEDRALLRGLLDTYREHQLAFMENPDAATTRSQEAYFEGSAEAFRSAQAIAESLTTDVINQSLIPILLETGYLVPLTKLERSSYPDLQVHPTLVQLWEPL
ncbi:Las1-like-domain-containing protein, partial [Dimargaris cristalligena]